MMKRIPATLTAALAAAVIPAAIVLAQTAAPPIHAPRLSAEARARILDGKLAMVKASLKLNEDQLKLWAPVEDYIRASRADRQKAWQERRQARASGNTAERSQLSLPDRLDRASERLTKRAERMKAFAAVFRPFYSALDNEQKAVAGVVLRQVGGDGLRMRGHRWAMQPSAERTKSK
jgi:hypothetical protein